jgi:hypothetical protein
MRTPVTVIFFCLAMPLLAQTVDFEGSPAVVLSNGKIELTVAITGATLADLVLTEDSARLSPYWNTARAMRMAGGSAKTAPGGLGHFLCLDGFGAPSQEEMKAGYPFHGEASSRKFEIVESGKSGSASTLKLHTQLPLAQESVTRTVQMVDGENVAYMETEVESLLSIDRPISWAEHATLGPPFLEPGRVIVDMPAGRCRVRAEKPGPIPGRLAPLQDFDWPIALRRQGGTANLLSVPENETALDLATCQIDPAREHGFVTAYHFEKGLLFGYIFNKQEFPWLMSWMNYTGNPQAARGIEFSTQPFDVSHRETVDAHEMFGSSTYRWLPAKSKIRTRFLLFYTKVPQDFPASSLNDVVLENGQITIKGKNGKSIVLAARLPLN